MQDFNYHTHTYRCGHAEYDYSDEEYVLDLINNGFKKMAFTDHSPERIKIDKRTNMRMEYDERLDYLRSIKELKEKYADKIEIKTGYEVEYLPGEEENIKELKEETDMLILGQHFVYDDDKNVKIFGNSVFGDKELLRYATYVEKAMELGIPDIIAHPDFYLIGRKKFGELEAKVAHKICKAAQEYNIPLEINLNNIYYRTYFENDMFDEITKDEKNAMISSVQYPRREFWDIARTYNIKVLYGIDAHFRGQISYWKKLVKLSSEILGEEIIDNLNFIEKI